MENEISFVKELTSYFTDYFRLRMENAKNTVQGFLLAGLLWILILGILIGVILMSSALVLYGIALGLSELLQGRFWLGALITGAFFLTATIFYIRRLSSKARSGAAFEKTKEYRERLVRHKATLDEFSGLIKQKIWPGTWMNERPFLTTGVSLLAGFIIAAQWNPFSTPEKENRSDLSSDHSKSEKTESKTEKASWPLLSLLIMMGKEVLEKFLISTVEEQWRKAAASSENTQPAPSS